MKQNRQRQTWETAGLFVTLLVGNTLHFVYDWAGQAEWAAYIAAVNESTWEHMKLLAVPWVVWTAVMGIALRDAGVIAGRTAGLLAGLAAIPVLFYTYTGALGVSEDVVNVAIFQAAALLAWWVSRRVQRRNGLSSPLWTAGGIVVLLGLAALFVMWTVAPPDLPLFTDPLDGTRGR